jgi:hypothetical protein
MDDDIKPEELIEKPGIVSYSFSKLRNQAECSARIFFSKLAKAGLIKEDYALPLVFGSAVHKGIELAIKEGKNPKQVFGEYVQENLLDKFKIAEHDKEKIIERTKHSEICLDNFMAIHYDQIMEEQPEIEVMLEAPFRKGTMRGVVDVLSHTRPWMDWKSGMKLPTERMLLRDPQSVIYYDLAKRVGMTPPTKFDYVYLLGKNVRMVEKEYQSGKRKGEKYMAADKENPMLLTRWSVQTDDDKVRRIFNEWVNPLAWEYENEVYVKKPSDMNCASCLYRTACAATELPERKYD